MQQAEERMLALNLQVSYVLARSTLTTRTFSQSYLHVLANVLRSACSSGLRQQTVSLDYSALFMGTSVTHREHHSII